MKRPGFRVTASKAGIKLAFYRTPQDRAGRFDVLAVNMVWSARKHTSIVACVGAEDGTVVVVERRAN